ncbi:bone marrow stromal antigen 2 isoform X2 [Canis aureus]
MAPTLYHYWPVPITDESESMSSSQKLSWLEWLGILWIPVVMGLSVALIIFVVKTNSKACRDGLLVEQECHNVTSLLERQLTQTRQALQGTMDQATTCNKTVVTLSASLVKEKAWGQEQLTRGEKLQGEIETLKQQLQAALEEVKQLREGKEASSKERETSSVSSLKASPGSVVVPVYLLLGLRALLA